MDTIDDVAGIISNGKCLAALFGGQLDLLKSYYDKQPPYIIPDVPGVAITWYGNTPDTMSASQCGIKAGEDLAAKELPINDLMDFQAVYDYTQGMGYQPGLTLLPIPYDWRRMAGNHEVTTTLQRTIEYAVKITGKKVIITAHSFGCLAFLTLMNSFSQQFKDQYIESFVGMACAWGGSSSAVGDYIEGKKMGFGKFGFPLDDQRTILTSGTSYFDLQPKAIFDKTTPWGQAINERALQEASWNSGNPPSNISFPWFPTPENDCYLDRSEDHLCGLHLYNFFSNPIVYTPNASYMVNQSSLISILDQFMVRTAAEIAFQKLVDEGKVSQQEQEQTWGTKKLIPKDRISLMMEMAQRNGAERLINPGVKIHHVYGGNLNTNTWYNITGDPRKSTDKGEAPKDDELKIYTHWGDSTVNIDNGIVPSLKWSWDFDNNVTNAKPVHMIDYCSNYSQIMYKNSTDKYTTNFTNITKNTYSGIMCNNYVHSRFPDDEFIVKFLVTVLKASTGGTAAQNLTETEVNTILGTCPHIMAPWQSQKFSEVYAYGIDTENLQQNKKNFDMPFAEPSAEFIQFLANFYNSLEQIQEEEFAQK
eukprot:TRINITY_DN1433_c0_g1_i3.p1 TRINITY_DN1433_c0_g1~~TRINITY_DN1433_c0_g1_i3.p1  ORF type:complete len:590 (-),score=74.96 TRINITY_DN1433_c0_g1_i3:43-1812(-)